jgi:protein arginine kinase activator
VSEDAGVAMKCEKCGKAQAKVHMTEIVSETDKREHHLCEKCAEKLGYTPPQQHFTISELLAGLASGQISANAGDTPDITCPSCGIAFAQFQSSGRFGCAQDYEVFAAQIEPRLERFHDAKQHCGKVPRSGDSAQRRAGRLRSLRAQLREAVAQESYEEAARLRDEIKTLERDDGTSKE